MSKCDCLELVAPYIDQLQSEVVFLISILTGEQLKWYQAWVGCSEQAEDDSE